MSDTDSNDENEDVKTVHCTRHCRADRYGFHCPPDCDCDCHDAYEWCTRCQNTGRVDADPLNDHVVEKVDCPRCGGRGYALKDGYEVKAVIMFGIDQCPGCGSKNVTQRSYRRDGGGLPPVTDVETVLVCHDCGRNTDEGDSQ